MSWIRSIPIFHLLLIILFAGDLGSHTFVIANAIDCTNGWTSANGFSSDVCYAADRTYYCTYCYRQDNLLPSASDCVDLNGDLANGGKWWNCDSAMTYNKYDRADGRPIICKHIYKADGSAKTYWCKAPIRKQQCARESCKP
ncbi:uncharacterized protein MELLADRAFT_123553 [Melampsora larici-populina 98AG31]|uniref:Secreted protein n=1 Tax=Melampsora larici-populina (strain 98AG31 / pathotype 3-4-7) TaxID=747676 RepID=F4RV38_MELLP|nr:uncharacterized protein MELLADRAFT_123553 [Melampsora larici-populina 98AG31]EGG03821.1 secreted protein [Melampsora larici-populina 98AG31]